MTNVFTTTGALMHSTLVLGLLNGQSYTLRSLPGRGWERKHERLSDQLLGGQYSRHDTAGGVGRGAERSAGSGDDADDAEFEYQRGSDPSLQHSGWNSLRGDDQCVHDDRGVSHLDVGSGTL